MIKVYEVLYNSGHGGGPAGDGTYVYRTRSKQEAEAFAEGKTVYGGPAVVDEVEVPRNVARRWNLA